MSLKKKSSHVYKLKDLIFLRWHYPKLPKDSTKFLSKFQQSFCRNGNANLQIRMQFQKTSNRQNTPEEKESWKTHTSLFQNLLKSDSNKTAWGASLVAQWLRICLPMQGTWVRALVWQNPTCRGATGPVSHNYWACVSGACAPQQERPTHRDEEWPPLATTRGSPRTETKTQHSHK